METKALRSLAFATLALLTCAHPTMSWAFETGVSDDRVSLPDGPGTLEGVGENVSVDQNMGLMRYAIPLTVPQGFAGVTPELAASYSSAGGSSTLGMGWSMTVPSIERMTMRGVPRYDETDRFVVNGGDELVRVSEEVGATEAAIYRHRFESDFTRYTWLDRQGGAGGYWQAEYADGRVGYFGADAQGRIVPSAIEAGVNGTFEYHLVEVVDVYGHRLRYDYLKDGAIALVSEISYVFTDDTPTYRVRFTYEPRGDAVWDAKAGFDRILRQRLAAVTVLTRGRQLRRYLLRYDDDARSGRRSRLAQVQPVGADDTPYPIVHSFGYSRGLGADCAAADCGRPILTTMVGEQGLGVNLQSGTANLIDINGDALPDLIDASTTQARHRFFLNQLASDGTHTFSSPRTSAIGEVSAFAVGDPRVQFIDVNGDGFTDLLSGGTSSQRVLLNRGGADWAALENLPGSPVWNGADAELRFMDYDNDMDIDLIRSTATETFAFENDGSFGFVRRDLAPLGVAFSESIQFTDINGDGLLDVVQLQARQLQYKINYGRGRFAGAWSTLAHPFDAGEVELAVVEDLDSDGYADIAVATGNTVRYVLNRNGDSFEPVRTISAVGGVSLPNREATTTVLAADMNGNGSIDIVWVAANGSVQYLDLFPMRSHLLARIENGIGRVTEIAYTPSVQQMARSAEEGLPWVHPLPYPMTVVARTDEYDLLTNVHDVVELRYRDGFYDGVERQFRGYAEVVQLEPGDGSTQGSGRTISRFDVGRTQPHLSGRMTFEARESDGARVDETATSYGDASQCPVAGVPSNARLQQLGRKPIGFACEVARETVTQEGGSSDAWVTTRTRMTYADGYGNVDTTVDEGVVAIGGGACAPCAGASGVFGAACGAQCLGDERFVERSYVPASQTGGRWLLGMVARERRFGVADHADGRFAEDVYHYDGEAFVGLPVGQLTQGKMTRQVSRVSDAQQLDVRRQRFDQHGNIVESLDPLGTAAGTTHRRTYAYDDDGLRVVQVDVFNEAEGAPYRLRRELQHDLLFDQVSLTTAWMKVEGDTVVSARDPTAYVYDAFGRLESALLPGGDSGAAPSIVYAYELESPSSRIITRRRSQVGGPLDLESIACVDGRGRTYQTRTKIEDGAYMVDGFAIYNLRSQQIRGHQSYTGASAACDTQPPAGVRFMEARYDGVGRLVARVHTDDDAPGGVSEEHYRYEPLRNVALDAEDLDPSSPHHATPEVTTFDGLGRTVAVERRLVGAASVTRLEYDALGHLTGYVDADGHRKRQVYDDLGRLLRIEDPNSGTTTLAYDDANNLVLRTDGRGVAVAYRYDGLNREVESFDPSDRDATLIRSAYDASASCDPSRCPNTAGNLVSQAYPGGADFVGYDVRRRGFNEVHVIEGRTYALRTDFDNADRVVGRAFPDGRALSYAYDGASRIKRIAGVIDDITYTPEGLLDTTVRANGVVDTRRYDARLRLTGVAVRDRGGAALEDLTLSRDRASNVTSARDAAPAALRPAATYQYDAWYRAQKADLGARSEVLAVNTIESIVRRNDVEYAFTAERPGAPSRVGDAAMGYDGAGNLTSAHGFTHTWDHLGRLTASAGAAGAVRSLYGADHMRVARHVEGEVTHYVAPDFEVRDGVSVVYARLGLTRVARLESADYARVWLGSGEGAATAGDAYLRRRGGEADQDAWLVASARRMLAEGRPDVVALHTDHVGSLVLATGAAGEVLGQQAFGLYGAIEGARGFVDRYGFTGQEHEPLTELVYFPHRFLSPRTGQWISPDPAFDALTPGALPRLHEAIGRYAYVLNNPGTLVDPTGLETHEIDGVIYAGDAFAYMRDKQLRPAMRRWMASEFSHENFDFLAETEAPFGDTKSIFHRLRLQGVLDRFIKYGARQQINISADMRDEILQVNRARRVRPERAQRLMNMARAEVAGMVDGGMNRFYESDAFKAVHKYRKWRPDAVARRTKSWAKAKAGAAGRALRAMSPSSGGRRG